MRRALTLLFLTLALGGCRGDSSSTTSSSSVKAQTRLFFLGIDGATWTILGPMLERRELPAFQRLVKEGAYLPQLDTLQITESPVIWTTVATGQRPLYHNIRGFTARLPSGHLIPVTSSLRRARAIWELADRRGLSSGVIGWWATWPAEKIRGYVVSDHANPAFADMMTAERRLWTADRDALSALRGQVYPEEIAPVLARHWITPEDFPWDDFQRRGGFTDEQVRVARQAPWNERDLYSWLKTFYRLDYPLSRVNLDLMRERPTALQMLYLRGPDPVQHYGWDLVEPGKFARQPTELERDRTVIEGVYRYVDTFLAEILDALPPDAWLIVASDHGAEPAESAGDPHRAARPGEHSMKAKGVLFVRGPGVRRGATLDRASVFDLMPTMAWLLELPISSQLPGKPLTSAFEEAFVRARPVRKVDSYGVRPKQPLLPSPEDEEMLKSLRNLGYIQ
ncbi:MAG TPA: alkaline phosphatase family protein [Thermoanaerobaculia bacterium]|nr:alkaline phosphatase family protein [Thermoanaerobaculia bacterium]